MILLATLQGLVGAADGKATFARPTGTDGTDNYYIGSSYLVWPFNYENNYYRHLSDYGGYSDTRDDDNDGTDVIGQHSSDWYFTSHNFANYPRQNQGTPYLCAFPGEDFYEFSLGGQKIMFEKVGPSIIAVSDVDINTYSTTTANVHSHVGTYTHVPSDASHLGINGVGSAFEVTSGNILPFRTYMTTTSAPVKRRIEIAERFSEQISHDNNEGDEKMDDAIHVYVNDNALVIESTIETTLPVYSLSGVHVLDVHVIPGITIQTIHKGVYITNKTKFIIK